MNKNKKYSKLEYIIHKQNKNIPNSNKYSKQSKKKSHPFRHQ